MPVNDEIGGKKEWEALSKVYSYLYETYPDFQSQVDKFGFSSVESNDKGELILETDSEESGIVLDKDKVVRLIKKAGLKRFSKIGSLSFDKVLGYDYNMVKNLTNIMVFRAKGGILSINLHFNYSESSEVPELNHFLYKDKDKSWSEEFNFGNFIELFSGLIQKESSKEGIHWIHMGSKTLNVSTLADGVISEDYSHGSDDNTDVVIERLLSYLSELFDYPIKDILILGESISKCRYKKQEDGEITVVLY